MKKIFTPTWGAYAMRFSAKDAVPRNAEKPRKTASAAARTLSQAVEGDLPDLLSYERDQQRR